MEIFANAFDGKTVFAPCPVYPPQIPFTSKVGRILARSSVLYPFSPSTSFISKSFGSINQISDFLQTIHAKKAAGNLKTDGSVPYEEKETENDLDDDDENDNESAPSLFIVFSFSVDFINAVDLVETPKAVSPKETLGIQKDIPVYLSKRSILI